MSQALPDRRSMSIGEVLAELRGDFPDVTISKIRFLEAEGLVEPERAPSGYRRFTHDDVGRLRYVLTSQRDHYLPLRVIKEHLDALDRGLEPIVPGGRPGVPRAVVDGGERGVPTLRRDPSDVRLTREELASAAGVDGDLLDQLESYGLVSPRAGGWFDADAVAVARAAGELASYGLEARHLRAFRTTADRQLGLVEQVVTPLLRQRGAGSRDRAEEAAREIAGVAVRLHTALVTSGLRGLGGR
ncbi:MAG TPA: MerR family transcriptional regulator [Jiangellales bacterium]|nr:MerR family transcriptional regulator [Jiangellales bacterium]